MERRGEERSAGEEGWDAGKGEGTESWERNEVEESVREDSLECQRDIFS